MIDIRQTSPSADLETFMAGKRIGFALSTTTPVTSVERSDPFQPHRARSVRKGSALTVVLSFSIASHGKTKTRPNASPACRWCRQGWKSFVNVPEWKSP
jgi:hypothetical protein